jgi:hypothetical protein
VYLGQVGEGLAPAQEGYVAAHRPGRLKGVIDLGQLGAQQFKATCALPDPQVLEGGDVAEIPHQRAHDRRMHPFHIAV